MRFWDTLRLVLFPPSSSLPLHLPVSCPAFTRLSLWKLARDRNATQNSFQGKGSVLIHRTEELCAGAQTAPGPISHLAFPCLPGSFILGPGRAKIAGHQFGLYADSFMHLHRVAHKA